jgi:hypothetical protein
VPAGEDDERLGALLVRQGEVVAALREQLDDLVVALQLPVDEDRRLVRVVVRGVSREDVLVCRDGALAGGDVLGRHVARLELLVDGARDEEARVLPLGVEFERAAEVLLGLGEPPRAVEPRAEVKLPALRLRVRLRRTRRRRLRLPRGRLSRARRRGGEREKDGDECSSHNFRLLRLESPRPAVLLLPPERDGALVGGVDGLGEDCA